MSVIHNTLDMSTFSFSIPERLHSIAGPFEYTRMSLPLTREIKDRATNDLNIL